MHRVPHGWQTTDMAKIGSTTKGSAGGGTPATTVVSETTAGQAAVVGTSVNYAREDHTHGTPAAGAGSGSVVGTVEVSLGNGGKPVTNGSFTITGTFTVGKAVMIQQASGPYTAGGTLSDAVEWDQISTTGYVLNATTIQCNWGCSTFVSVM
jgi:hypothetical protein